jgi:hypothetical protein
MRPAKKSLLPAVRLARIVGARQRDARRESDLIFAENDISFCDRLFEGLSIGWVAQGASIGRCVGAQ